MIYHSVAELIGNTPLLQLTKLKCNNNLFAKCELFNPAGGLKDRVALYALKELKKQGIINENSIIISATAGNTGLGLALAALEFNLKVILVVAEKFSPEKQILMKALGAKLIITPKKEGMQGSIDKAKELVRQNPNAYYFDQFTNEFNPKAHYENTAREIFADLGTRIDYFVCGAGSGGSFSGIASFLKEQIPHIKCVLCDPVGSIIGGGEAKEAHIEGVGNNFIPQTMNTSLIDEVIKINDEEAFEGVRLLARTEGILAGISSGACLMACLKLSQKVQNKTIVTLFADSLDRYFHKIEQFKILDEMRNF